jgi:hypothetical protein
MRVPIWFVVKECHGDGRRSIPCNAAGAAIGFTATNKLISFLESQHGEGTLSVASDADELLLLAADLHRQGAAQICLDPDREGNNARRLVSLSDLLDFARREKADSDTRWERRRVPK